MNICRMRLAASLFGALLYTLMPPSLVSERKAEQARLYSITDSNVSLGINNDQNIAWLIFHFRQWQPV